VQTVVIVSSLPTPSVITCRNATSFSTYAGKVHVDHYIWYLKLMYLLGEAAPSSRRGVPQGPARIKPDEGAHWSVVCVRVDSFV